MNDREILNDFFRGMLSKGDFANVLLGDKPACCDSWVWWLSKSPKGKTGEFLLLYRGWRVWQKYESLFSLKRICLIEEKYNNHTFSLWCVKHSYLEQIRSYFERFDCSRDRHYLTGKILGFPEKNIEDFCKVKSIQATLFFLPYDIHDDSISSTPDNSLLLDGYPVDLIEEYHIMKQKFHLEVVSGSKEPFFSSSSYVYASYSDSCKKTEDEIWKQKIAQLYNSDNFLEDILMLMESQ